MIDNRLSNKIAFFHILGLLLVIPIHITLKVDPAFAHFFVSPFRIFCHAFQPIYFGLAGFLFFQNFNEDILDKCKNKIMNRVKSLFVPYVLWNVMAFGLYLLLVRYGIKSYLVDNFQSLYASKNIFDLIFHIPVDEHLWFIQDLIVVSILSYPLYYVLNKNKWYSLLVLVIASVFIHQTKMASITSFAIGAYVGINKRDLLVSACKSKILCISCIIGSIAVIFLQLIFTFPMNTLFMLSWITAFSLWYIYDVMHLDRRLCSVKMGGVRKYFFFVYLAHDPLLSIVCHKLSVWSVHSLENSIIIYFLVFIGIITLVAFLGFLIDKYFHRVFAFLTGGR